MTSYAAPARAQQEDEQLWLQVTTHVPLADNLRLTIDQVGRVSGDEGGLYTTQFGGMLGVELAKEVEAGFGYRRVDAHNRNTAAGENRLSQQVTATFGHFTTRLMIDERFSEGGPGTGFRIRPLFRLNHPLNDRRLGLFVSHESFILPNSTRWGQRSGYDRMRNMVGLTVPVGSRVSADIGYLNQYRISRAGTRAQMIHALSLDLTINLARPRGTARAMPVLKAPGIYARMNSRPDGQQR